MKRILLICAFLLALAVQAGAQSKQQQQQPVEVNGLVVDSDDVPIVGATVYIKDEPGIGSITNSEGRFKLTAKLYNTLAVSFMGYETAEQIITSAADVKIDPFPAASMIESLLPRRERLVGIEKVPS